jgi:predicted DsbA family dithiol-disulfide isomerase
MPVTVWSDYLCPWCYLGQHRTALLRSWGLDVRVAPFALHPEWGPAGQRVGRRLAEVLDRIGTACAELGMPFVAPTRLPNTNRALQAAVLVAAGHPGSADALHAALFAAVFVEGVDLADPAALRGIVAAQVADADLDALDHALDRGVAWDAVMTSTAEAHEAGATGAPAWWIDGRLLVPGVQPVEQFQRWVERLEATRVR